RHALTVPILIIGAIALYYLWKAATGNLVTSATLPDWQAGLAFDQKAGGVSPLFIVTQAPRRLKSAGWGLLPTVPPTTLVSILLTASALEVAADEEIDLNRELRAAGMATVAAGIGGGMVGFHSLSMSRLVLSMGGASRSVGLGSAAVCGVCLFFGPVSVSLVPQYICGGLLFFLGLTFLLVLGL